MNLTAIPPKVWKTDLEEFREKTRAFYAGEMDKGAYKSFSGYYGSYAQKGGKANMLRLRMPAGVVTKERLAFTAGAIKKYQIPRDILPPARPSSSTTWGLTPQAGSWRRPWMRGS